MRRGTRAAALSLASLGLAALGAGAEDVGRAPSAPQRFREGTDLIRGRDFPKGLAVYQEVAASGGESASLYWNWAQAAAARGGQGEALWALLRGREVEPGDRALPREIEKLREALNLDPAEIAPEPLAAVSRFARRFHVAWAAVTLLGLSLVLHAATRFVARGPSSARLGLGAFALGAVLAAIAYAGSLGRPTGVVVRRGAPLTDAASPSAQATGSLREGEVVPILEASGAYLRVEDSAGARGWARAQDVRRLDLPPPHYPRLASLVRSANSAD